MAAESDNSGIFPDLFRIFLYYDGKYNRNGNWRNRYRTDNEAVLRIHDNCGKFNPKKYYETVYAGENKEDNVGIRLIMEMAKDISYTSTLKLNNICIRV